jgi:hypothetical protein
MRLTTHCRRSCIHSVIEPRTRADSLHKWCKLRKIDTRFVTWNVRSLYRTGLLMTVERELLKCKLDLVGVQEVKHFSMEMGLRIMSWILFCCVFFSFVHMRVSY